MQNQLQTQAELNQKIIQRLAKLAEKTGIKVELKSDYFWTKYKFNNKDNKIVDKIELLNNFQYNKHLHKDNFPAIQEPQIKDILIAYERVLGDNKNKKDFLYGLKMKTESLNREVQNNTYQNIRYDDLLSCMFLLRDLKVGDYPSHAQVLYKDWCEGWTQSLFKTNPIKVLTEFLNVLENIK